MKNSLSITRHATQELLRRAFNALPAVTYGLLRGRHGVVQAICPFNYHRPASATMTKYAQSLAQSLESDGMELLALYASSASSDECVDDLHNRTIQAISGMDGETCTRLRELPLLMVRLDTEGRMEAVLFAATPAGVIELPLILQEGISPGDS